MARDSMALFGGFGGMFVGPIIPVTALTVVPQFTKPAWFLSLSEDLTSVENVFTPMAGITNV